MKTLWLLLVAVVVLSNALMLAGAGYNRSAVVQQITLTERELSLPYGVSRATHDNSQLSLVIHWQVPLNEAAQSSYQRRLRVDADVFRSLKLLPIHCGDKERQFAKKVKGWVALEYAGPAYQQDQQRLEAAMAALGDEGAEDEDSQFNRYERQLDHLLRHGSRLYAVAVAPNVAELQRQLPDPLQSYWFVPAKLSAAGACTSNEVVISTLLVDRLHLSKGQRARLFQRNHQPFAIELFVGRRHQPWVAAVAACPAAGCR